MSECCREFACGCVSWLPRVGCYCAAATVDLILNRLLLAGVHLLLMGLRRLAGDWQVAMDQVDDQVVAATVPYSSGEESLESGCHRSCDVRN